MERIAKSPTQLPTHAFPLFALLFFTPLRSSSPPFGIEVDREIPYKPIVDEALDMAKSQSGFEPSCGVLMLERHARGQGGGEGLEENVVVITVPMTAVVFSVSWPQLHRSLPRCALVATSGYRSCSRHPRRAANRSRSARQTRYM